MAAFLDRIERINPAINAIVSLRPRDELLAEARAADAAPRRGRLHGMPFAIKDLVETAGIRTTHGSPHLCRPRARRRTTCSPRASAPPARS